MQSFVYRLAYIASCLILNVQMSLSRHLGGLINKRTPAKLSCNINMNIQCYLFRLLTNAQCSLGMIFGLAMTASFRSRITYQHFCCICVAVPIQPLEF